MAPVLRRRANPGELKTWLIAVCVVASVVVTALVVYLVVFRLRNKQYQEAARRDPYLTRKEWARRRKLSNLQRLEEEESQRQLILRKTLTSRTSSRDGSADFESRRDGGSAEEARSEAGRSEEWKRWEAGYGDAEDAAEGHPLIEQHPAVKGDDNRLPRSASPTRAPLLSLQEPEPQGSASLWARRLSDLHNNGSRPPQRTPPGAPPRAPPASCPAPEPFIGRPHNLFAHHPLHNSSPRPTRSAGDLQRQPPSHRSRAASADARPIPSVRIDAPSSHTRASSHPLKLAPPQIPTSTRARSSSASPVPSINLVSPPPPAALPRSASPRSDGFPARELEQPRTATQRDRPLSWVPAQAAQEQTIHTRARSHEMLPYHRMPSPVPAQSPRRKPVPGALGGRISTSSLAGGARAAVVSPSVSPVEEATLESERTPVSPGGTLTTNGPSAIIQEMENRQWRASSDRDILPSQRQQSFQREPIPAAPQPITTNNASSEEDSQPSSFEGGGDFFEGPKVSLSRLPAQPERRSSSPRPSGYLEAENNDEVGTAFSFEVGDQVKELGISVRRLPQRSPSPSAAPEQHQQEDEIDSDEELGSTFSFEEGDRLKELSVSTRDPATQRPNDSIEPPRPHQSGTQQQADRANNFEEDSQLKEMGLSQGDPPPAKRRHSPLAQLDIPRLNKDRSRSFEDRNKNQAGLELTPEDIATRLRSRSFEPITQGRWELQVSVLDQTGARHSREGAESDYYSSASEPGSPEENTFDAELPAAQVARPVRPSVVPVGPKRQPPAKASPVATHNRTPSTPLTSPDSDTSGLCRANFASPVKEKQLAEEQFPRSPPAARPPFSPVSASAPTQQPAVPSPREVGWSVSSAAGWGGSWTAEAEDTMKETWGSGPQVEGDAEKEKVSFRLSGPPDFMPAFF